MAQVCLPHRQRCILAQLAQEEARTQCTMAASYHDLARALAHDQGNLSTSLANLEAEGLITIARTPCGKAELVRYPGAGGDAPHVGRLEMRQRFHTQQELVSLPCIA
jgi:hypothetical protein